MSQDACSLRDEAVLLRRSLDDARAEHARGELDVEGLAAIERRDAARLSVIAELLAALPPDGAHEAHPRARSTARPRRSRRLVATCALALVLAAGTIGVVLGKPFAAASPRVHLSGIQEIEVLQLLAERYVAIGQNTRALTTYDAVLKLDPRDPEAFIESGWLHYEAGVVGHRRGEVNLGAAMLRRSISVYAGNAASHLYDGIVLLQHDHNLVGAHTEVLRSAELPESKPEAALTSELLVYLAQH